MSEADAAAAVDAYIALGGNQGPVRETLERAIEALSRLPETRLARRSAFYRTPAWGLADQPDFINAVVQLETRLAPEALLEAMLGIERGLGRERDADGLRWGPRGVDLDLLLHDDAVMDTPGLGLPHPRLHERAFVLVPLAEIAPWVLVPRRGRARDLLATVDVSGIEAIP